MNCYLPTYDLENIVFLPSPILETIVKMSCISGIFFSSSPASLSPKPKRKIMCAMITLLNNDDDDESGNINLDVGDENIQ